MIIYLISSTVCMGILLVFYHFVLETEKMHSINRGYLIFSLIFSLSIPLIPVGIVDGLLPLIQSQQDTQSEIYTSLPGEWLKTGSDVMVERSKQSGISLYLVSRIGFLIYSIVAGFLLIRLLRIIYMIQLKADRNQKKLLENYEIVLLNEKVIPHTFLSTIFLNKDQYLRNKIPDEVLIHELTHARQKHSLDILFVEFLKIIFWFNPVLYLYKKAILLNQEFLADEAVISKGTQISEYQTLLLENLTNHPSYGLSSQFSYKTTKKRVLMMLQTTSKTRSSIKFISLIPLFISLSLLLGCEYNPSDYADEETVAKKLTIEISDSDVLNINGDEMKFSEFEEFLSNLPEPPEQVTVEVDSNATMGIVSDVQQLLRSHELLKITYSSNQERNKEKLKQVTQKFLDTANTYMNMSVQDTNPEILQKEYDELLKLYEQIKNMGIRIPDSPPPPPLVPSPEERIKNIKASPEKPEPPAPPKQKESDFKFID